MSLLIVTSRYLKAGNKKAESKRKNYTKYIATREGAEIRKQGSNTKTLSTDNQKKLLNELLNDFPETQKYLEYEDYTTSPTLANARELINAIIERNADVVGNRKNYIGYMALRPGAEKRGQHGLFNGSDEPIVLNRVAQEVAHHQGIVWSHVVSLRREDAVRLGYDNSDMWRDLVMRHITDIAKAQKIQLSNLKWYAAFHNTTHHPHIHLIVYSTNPKEGYLTEAGIKKIKSAFANDIFHDELQSIYQEQTLSRDELKLLSENHTVDIIKRINEADYNNPQLENLIRVLYKQLQSVKGKKVYGYLPKEVKKTVNDIFAMLSKDKNISDLYEKWCNQERLKYKIYNIDAKEIPPLYDNKVFQPVRNMIIRKVSELIDAFGVNEPDFNAFDDIEETFSDETISDNNTKCSEACKAALETLLDKGYSNDEKKLAIQQLEVEADKGNMQAKRIVAQELLSGEYVLRNVSLGLAMLTECADSGDTIAAYRLGKVYCNSKWISPDYDRAEKYLKIAAVGNNDHAMYALAKLYLTPESENAAEAVRLLEAVATDNMIAAYLLGRIYYYGTDGVAPDKEKGMAWLMQSAADGNAYAQNIIDNSGSYENALVTDSVIGLLSSLSRIISDDYDKQQRKFGSQVDKKLRRSIDRKKQEIGIKSEYGQTY